ncbi:POL1 protein, partial [Circaetus pectoralis]|nr:POL1 protein [Circaetus pectoralis]
LPILPVTQVVQHPIDGRTVFTDASSKTCRAVFVWQEEGVWHQVTHTEPGRLVQYLEAKAVTLALMRWPTEPLNVVTDSLFVYKLLVASLYALDSTTEVGGMLLNALQLHDAAVFPIHVTSPSNLPRLLTEGNMYSDQIAQALTALTLNDSSAPARTRAITLHRLLHCGARGLVRLMGISRSEARDIVVACPHCSG